MTREELIESLTLLKEQARNSVANTFVWDVNIDGFNFVIDSAVKALEQESKTGHWREDIDNNRRWDRVRFYCSECGDWQTYGKTHYCPNCGAKMESEKKQ